MASREHQSGATRIKVATIHTDVIGSFIEWGGEAWREKKHSIPAVWWNPLTWGKYEWRREGSPPITAVEFFRGNGDPIPESVLGAQGVSEPGYRKLSCVYTFVSTGTGRGPADLGNDARSVANVKVTYTWDGTSRTLPDH
jgi:hypothetical protein